ncbi:MAG: Hsp20/alpha crystallin family protein [Melioribacteraceae bacterium]|nr:Hsp20/alpha crystallin family protein [Melioribacteraceae bacterium]
MTLIRFEPMRDLDHISNRFQRFFDEFPGLHNSNLESFSPRIDISEGEKTILIDAEIPGVPKENLKITLQDNILTIEGEKKKASEEKEKNFYREERCFGKFKRSFTLPVEVDSENVDAKFIDGILEIKLNKLEPKQEKERVIELK